MSIWDMFDVPSGIIVLLAVTGTFAAICIWALARDLRTPGGRPDLFRMIEEWVGVFLLYSMLAAGLLQVMVRYIGGNIDMPWTEEFGRLLMVWGAFWGAAMVQRTDEHISVTIVTDYLPAPVQNVIRIAVDVLILAALAPIVWFGWETARMQDIMFAISIGMPLSVFAYSVPIGGALMMIHTVLLIIRRMLGRPIPVYTEPEI